MNGRKAKSLRRRGMCANYEWYKSLLPEEQAGELTSDLAVQYTPQVEYWTERQPNGKETLHVSEGTRRWFYLQEKKYAKCG